VLFRSNACYFRIGDDADSVAQGTLDLNARTCSATWTFNYAGSYSLTAWVNTSSAASAMSATITLSVSGGSNPRCTGLSGAPTACTYRWVEVYYSWSNGTRRSRVCAIDGGCQWQTAHLSWSQVAQADYWINSTGRQLPNGDAADAYLCLGSAPADWTSYSSTHDFDALLGRAETSARPLPAGTC